ncbi:MAG: lysophospholipid acyltransferase family protein [Amphiplicatus sp.]
MTDAGAAPHAPLPARRSNRPVTPLAFAEDIAARALLGLFRVMGVDRASAFSGKTLRAVGPLLRPISKRADDNLRLIFPDWDEEKRRAVIADVFENLGRTVAEYAHLDAFDPADPRGRLEVIGIERVADIVLNREPAIYVSGHFANWEILPIILRHVGVDFGLVYRAVNNPLIDELIIKLRGEAFSRLQVPKGRLSGRALMDALARGGSLAMLVDQKLNEGVVVPFLGHPAKTATAAARLALRYSVPVIPGSIERVDGARFRIHVHEPIRYPATGDLSTDVTALTTLINQSIGAAILDHPEQWLWFHRRWAKPQRRT